MYITVFSRLYSPAPFPMPLADTLIIQAVYELGTLPQLFGRYTAWMGVTRESIHERVKQEGLEISPLKLHYALARLSDQHFIGREYRTDAKRGYVPQGWVTSYFSDPIAEHPTYFDTTMSIQEGVIP
jgi:hypothetical protein